MKRVLIASIVSAATLVAVPIASAQTLDQQQTTSNRNIGLFTYGSGAQTFTAGISGPLGQADLKLFRIGNAPQTVRVEIRNTSAGRPGTTVLARATIPTASLAYSTSGAFAPVTFAPPAPVTAGTLYALVAWSTGSVSNTAGWNYQDSGNPYLGGAKFANRGGVPPDGNWSDEAQAEEDFAFKTYVGLPTGTCKGQQATVQGTEGPDEITGTPERDVISGLGGKDDIRGLAGKDLICGGKGKDTLRGGKGKDKLRGGKGKDKLAGGGGKDRCIGGRKDDTAKKCEVEKSI